MQWPEKWPPLIAAFVDRFARRAKNARPCLGRIGTPRDGPAPDRQNGTSSLPTSKRYGIASYFSTQTLEKVLGYPGIGGQFDRPAVGVGGLRGPS